MCGSPSTDSPFTETSPNGTLATAWVVLRASENALEMASSPPHLCCGLRTQIRTQIRVPAPRIPTLSTLGVVSSGGWGGVGRGSGHPRFLTPPMLLFITPGPEVCCYKNAQLESLAITLMRGYKLTPTYLGQISTRFHSRGAGVGGGGWKREIERNKSSERELVS